MASESGLPQHEGETPRGEGAGHPEPAAAAPPRPGALPRLETRLERLRTDFRFTYAFHARELRFERGEGEGFVRIFAETFSFHADRHDPAELYLQLEDLWSKPRLLGPRASRRDAEELMTRFLVALPGYLEGILERVGQTRREEAARSRVGEDAAVFGQIVSRFLVEHDLERDPRLRLAAFHLRRLVLRALLLVMDARVSPAFLDAYRAGEGEVVPASTDPNDISFFYALARGAPEEVESRIVASAERAFFRWVEEVCLDVDNRAFEVENSPFEEREREVLRAISSTDRPRVRRSRDLVPFLCRPGHRDCRRVLRSLEAFFLRQYDVPHAAALRHHGADLARGRQRPGRTLSWHSRSTYLLLLGLPLIPFGGAALAYERAPAFFDTLISVEISVVMAVAFWFLAYQFMWRRDLTVFHASVPRVAAGIIVGYLPVFLIDEVWDLAEQSLMPLGTVVFLLGSTTLLYLYVEVQRKLGESREAFGRAVDLFLLGLNESAAFGLVVTTLLGPLMAVRNWGTEGAAGVAELRSTLPPFLGELPRILGVEPLLSFPTAVLLMTVLAFFIGTFLQLLWEDLPITEPM